MQAEFRDVLEPPEVYPRAVPWYQWLAALPIRAYWWCFAAVAGLMTWNAFYRLGDTFVRDHDEARYGVAASEMLRAHSMLVTTYGGATEFWNLKPPLGYWLLELSYRLAGENQLGLRLPAAVCALLIVVLTMLLARKVADRRVAILAGLALATSFGFVAHHGARSGDLDIALTLPLLIFLMLAPHLANTRAARLGAGLVLALAFLIKSFAILPFVAAVMLYCLMTRGIGSWRIWPLPLAIPALVIAVWAVARSVAEGSWEFVRRMFLEDLFLRTTTQIDPDPHRHAWDYVGALFDRLAPWPLLALLAWGLTRTFARQRLSADLATLLGCYALLPLLLFTLARTHHSHYIIPTYPAWAILGAAGALEIFKYAREQQRVGLAAGILIACVLACEIRLISHVEVNDRTPPSQLFLASLGSRLDPSSASVLHTTFTPSYSERFFLQVVDGLRVDDVANTDAPIVPGSYWLLKRTNLQWPRALATAAAVIIAQSEEYQLVRVSQ